MNEQRSISGRPITGNVEHYTSPRGPQGTAEEFLAEVDQAFATVPGLLRIRWHQYTPYFNDGEPCVFEIHGVYFELEWTTGDEYGDYEDGFVDEWDLYTRDYSQPGKSQPVYKVDGRDTEAEYTAVKAAMTGLASGRYHDVVQEAFGDPAKVTASRDGFDVEFYEHD
jgi:hypothetical protein